MNIKQSFVGGIVAFLFATSCCWIPWLLITIGASGSIWISDKLGSYSLLFTIIAIGFLAYGLFKLYTKMTEVEIISNIDLLSTITCPECGYKKEETMPTDACQYFYECTSCKKVLKPINNDCCVYCSFGTVPCPPIQLNQSCC